MRVMVLVPASPETEATVLPTTDDIAEMSAYNEQLVQAGIMLAGEGLHPSVKGKRVVFDENNASTVVDGPFTETKELVAGFWIWQVKSMDEAVEWARRAPFRATEATGPIALQIRPIFEAEDFGDALTPELREQEAELRSRASANQ